MAIHRRDDACGNGFAFLHQRFDPHAKSTLVEPIARADRGCVPQIQIEHRRQLWRSGRCDEGDTGVESAISNQMMKDLWGQARHDMRKVRRIEQTSKPIVCATAAAGCEVTRGCRNRRSVRPAAVSVTKTTTGAF
jgi:hypothetical protein